MNTRKRTAQPKVPAARSVFAPPRLEPLDTLPPLDGLPTDETLAALSHHVAQQQQSHQRHGATTRPAAAVAAAAVTVPALVARIDERTERLRALRQSRYATNPLMRPTDRTLRQQDNPTAWLALAEQRAADIGWAEASFDRASGGWVEWRDLARFVGHSARGVDRYAVPSFSQPERVYGVAVATAAASYAGSSHNSAVYTRAPWRCACAAGQRGIACHHVGAASWLAKLRVYTAVAREHIGGIELGAGSVRYAGATWTGRERFSVAASPQMAWRRVEVVYDPARDVVVCCACGWRGCAHAGATLIWTDMRGRVAKVSARYGW